MVHVVDNSIFIPGSVPSSKNSKQWTGKFLINSKTTQNYIKNYGVFYKDANNKRKFKQLLEQVEKPYKIGFYFIREQRRLFDYINMAQLPQDLMVENGWLDDDNCDEMIPVFLGHTWNKAQPGLQISVQGADLNKVDFTIELRTTTGLDQQMLEHYTL